MAQESDKALRSFYGASDKNRMKALTGSPDIHREQTVYTPEMILGPVRKLWPEGIQLDPCSGPSSIVGAEHSLYVPPTIIPAPTKKDPERTRVIYDEKHPDNGLKWGWVERTYVNPPFALLEDWLQKAMEESVTIKEIIVLAPVRTHRKWWRECACLASDVCYLNSVTFEGHDQAFPAPLCLFYFGNRDFRSAMDGIGDCSVWS